MTAKHLLEGVMQWTEARHHKQCADILGVDAATLCRIAKGKATGMHLDTLDRIQRVTGLPIEMLFAWYRLPEGAHLGRILSGAVRAVRSDLSIS
ncbi:MAG: hypothetical protein ACXVCX_22070 [Ktedonobacterales bacterium]